MSNRAALDARTEEVGMSHYKKTAQWQTAGWTLVIVMEVVVIASRFIA